MLKRLFFYIWPSDLFIGLSLPICELTFGLVISITLSKFQEGYLCYVNMVFSMVDPTFMIVLWIQDLFNLTQFNHMTYIYMWTRRFSIGSYWTSLIEIGLKWEIKVWPSDLPIDPTQPIYELNVAFVKRIKLKWP